MCGRYFFREADYEVLMQEDLVQEASFHGGEIYPSQEAPVLQADHSLCMAQWGYQFEGKKSLLLHARAETVEEKYFFRESFFSKRVLIPSSGFYEWKHENGKSLKGQKYFFTIPGENRLYMAGLLLAASNANEDAGEMALAKARFVILTREASNAMLGIHDRSPLVLDASEAAAWLADANTARYLLKRPGIVLTKEYQGT